MPVCWISHAEESIGTVVFARGAFVIKSYYRILTFSILGACLVPLIVIMCSRWAFIEDPYTNRVLVKPAIVLTCAFALAFYILRRTRESTEVLSKQQADFLDNLPEKRLDLAVAASACLSLFFELSVIRWQSTEFTVFSFYKNFSLLACFGGLGLGYALAGRRHIPLILSVPVLALQGLMFAAINYFAPGSLRLSLDATPISEQYNMGFLAARNLAQFAAIYPFLIAVFLLTILAFLPIGQVCGRLMRRRESLRSYGHNLLGSIVGVLLTLFMSALWTPPVVWFALCWIGILGFAAFSRRSLVFTAGCALFCLILIAWPLSFPLDRIYSPYQLIERGQDKSGYMEIRTAGLYHQRVFDLSLSNANRKTNERLRAAANYYELPYRVNGQPGTVAIVGAGTGNDVAAALRSGAQRVDAIEIDPAIFSLGDFYHPEQPYADSRVSVWINDARTHLRNTKNSYDVIAYGLLDSHALLSHASSVRIDSFVYTVEGFREARTRLKENGIISLSFAVMTDEMGRKIYLMLQEAFDGIPPACIRAGYDDALIFLAGKSRKVEIKPDLLRDTGFTDCSAKYARLPYRPELSTDDWPFFYMPKRVFPVSALGLLAVAVAVFSLLTAAFSAGRPRPGHIPFFFLGAAFMLVETKGITELGLTFGNTWRVIGIVIAGVLLMAYLANQTVAWLEIRRPFIPFLLLLASLTFGYGVARWGGLPSTALGRLAALGVLTCPMYFSGLVFSTLLRRTEDISGIMALNLVGAMVGGLLEYNSMYFGFRFLYLLALGLYFVGFVSYMAFRPAKA